MRARQSDPGGHLLGVSLRTIGGRLACSDSACTERSGLACEFVDRRGRSCPTAWCPHHRLVLDGAILCRRHAGVRAALAAPATGDASPDPDLGVRSPALVNWVGHDVDRGVRGLLGAPAQRIEAGAVRLVAAADGAGRAWERRWTSGGHVVCLRVGEDDPDELAVLVDGSESARLVPPWIVDRRSGGDDTARRHFSDLVIGAVKAGLLTSRP